MTPQTILNELWAAGIDLQLSDDGVNLVAPAGKLSDANRQMVLSNKPALIDFIREAHDTTTALIEAAMRACDRHNDSEAAREQMRADCLDTPLHLRSDLLDHFQKTYGAKS
jgi:hypothetical protein